MAKRTKGLKRKIKKLIKRFGVQKRKKQNPETMSIKARHDERKRKRIREQKRRRYTFFTVLALIAVLLITYLTPIFNIKKVEIEGNVRLETKQITKQIGNLKGKNLFGFGKMKLKRKIIKMSYVSEVKIKRKLIPPTVVVEITECNPSYQIKFGNTFIVVDKDSKVLEKREQKYDNVAVLEGISVSSANVGAKISFKDAKTGKTLNNCIRLMEKAGILGDITTISFEDLSNIRFNYQNRLDVVCGSDVDFQRKLALFKEAITSSKLTENSRGTINLSTKGKAIYTP